MDCSLFPIMETTHYCWYQKRDHVMALNEANEHTKLQPGGPYQVQASPLNPNELIVVHYDGLANLIYNEGTIHYEQLPKKFHAG